MRKNYTPDNITLNGIRNTEELKILICYLCEKIKEPINLDDILDIVLLTEVSDYFDCVNAFNDLIKKENLILATNSDKYELSSSGHLIADCLNRDLPKATKDKVISVAMTLQNRKKVKKQNNVTIKSADNGYQVTCNISGGEMSLMNFTIFVPTYDEAKLVEDNFLDYPSLIYNVMLAAVTRNDDLISNALNNYLDEHIKNE